MNSRINLIDQDNLQLSKQNAVTGKADIKSSFAKSRAEVPDAGFLKIEKAAGNNELYAPKTNVLSAQKDISNKKNLDIILSHTLSAKDYEEARNEGYDPSEIDVKEIVTIVDQIKASLLKSGVRIEGVTDDLSPDQLKAITGSEAYANELIKSFKENDIPLTDDNINEIAYAVEKASSLRELGDNSKNYIIDNGLVPSVDNIYIAEHASPRNTVSRQSGGFFSQGMGYVAVGSDSDDLSGLSGGIDELIKRAKLEENKETAESEAKRLVRSGIALTEKNLETAVKLSDMKLPPNVNDVIKAGAVAIAAGKKASQADLTNTESLLEKAMRIDSEVREISEKDVEAAVIRSEELGRDISELSIDDMLRLRSAGAAVSGSADSGKLLEARLRLEEVRFSMSVSANYSLLKSGFQIDTAPMKELIDRLSSAIKENAKALFGQDGSGFSAEVSMSESQHTLSVSDGINTLNTTVKQTSLEIRYRLYEETNLKAAFLKNYLPVGVIGALSDQFKTDTLDDIYTGATTWKLADTAYAAMQTEIRKDLGDNIKKAFGTSKQLLDSIGVRADEYSLRAVRILSYNNMDVTAENISKVTEFDSKLESVLASLKPLAVLEMIRDGKNPLNMTLDELEEALKNTKTKNYDEKYSRFLYKLEQSGEITADEKTSYIGIYRMFETLQKTDHAAIGTLLNTGADMSVKNLLTATRTLQAVEKRGIDVSVDERSGGFEISKKTNAIDTQISAAFSRYSAQADTAFEYIEPEKMKKMGDAENSMLSDFASAMKDIPSDKKLDLQYAQTRLNEMRASIESGKNISELEDVFEETKLAVNEANIEAYAKLLDSRRIKSGSSLWEEAVKIRGAGSAISGLIESLGETEDFAQVYKNNLEKIQKSILNETTETENTYVDLKALSLLNRQLGMASRFAGAGSFEIPVEKDGRLISMQVSLREAVSNESYVSVSLETEKYGRLSARFEIRHDEVRGTISTSLGSSPETKSYMESLKRSFVSEVAAKEKRLGISDSSIGVMYGAVKKDSVQDEADKGPDSTRDYLKLAKIFTTVV